MEIVLRTKKKAKIKRANGRGGIIRIDEESCQIIEGILNKLQGDMDVKQLASTLIKEAANNLIIKEERQEDIDE